MNHNSPVARRRIGRLWSPALVAAVVASLLGLGGPASATLDPVVRPKLVANDSASTDYFGWSVALDGDTALVGAHYDDDKGVDSGSAYVFRRSGGAWTQEAKLTASDGAAKDHFGWAVALAGDTALIGAPNASNVGTDTGAAYVFVRGPSGWQQQAKLSGGLVPYNGDHFGAAVALAGDRALVGAPEADVLEGGIVLRSDMGAAHIFVRSASAWGLEQTLHGSDSAAGDRFGAAVALSDDRALVGAPANDHYGTDGGSAYVFNRSGSTWAQDPYVLLPDTTPGDGGSTGDALGTSVALSGDTALVGAIGDDDHGSNTGAAYVFVPQGGGWSRQTKLTSPTGNHNSLFASAVALSGDHALVGSWGQDYGRGGAYFFERANGVWGLGKSLSPDVADGEQEFGVSVALSGRDALVGAYGDNTPDASSGSAYPVVLDQPPVAAEDAATVSAGQSVRIPVTANDIDPDGDPLTASIPNGGEFGPPAQHGTATCAGDTCTYSAASGYSGPDSFTYGVSDGLETVHNIVKVTVQAAPGDDGQLGGAGGGGGGPLSHRSGYWMVGSDGVVYGFGDAHHYGNAPVASAAAVDLEPTSTGNGYWIVDNLGRVYAFGDAVGRGSVDRAKLVAGETVTSLSATRNDGGYWIFTTRGRVLPFGDAVHYGDMSAVKLNGPVLDSIPTPSGKGYYMVASDGGIFAFGDAKFYGSMGGTRLNAPVQSLVPDGDGVGYWLVASDGGIFAFESPFRGSMGSARLNKPVTGMVRFGNGYLMVGEDGGIFNFSDRAFYGSLGGNPPKNAITSVAALDT